MPQKNCTYCGRENSGEAAQCLECGTALSSNHDLPAPLDLSKTDESADPESAHRARAEEQIQRGATMFFVGSAITVGSYLLAGSPFGVGFYIIAWGPVLFGAIRFLEGWSARKRTARETVERSHEAEAHLALGQATILERKGRVIEAAAAYQKVTEDYPDTEAARDAEKSFISLRKTLS